MVVDVERDAFEPAELEEGFELEISDTALEYHGAVDKERLGGGSEEGGHVEGGDGLVEIGIYADEVVLLLVFLEEVEDNESKIIELFDDGLSNLSDQIIKSIWNTLNELIPNRFVFDDYLPITTNHLPFRIRLDLYHNTPIP